MWWSGAVRRKPAGTIYPKGRRFLWKAGFSSTSGKGRRAKRRAACGCGPIGCSFCPAGVEAVAGQRVDLGRKAGRLGSGEANLRLIRDELIPLQQRRRALAEDSYRLGESEALALFAAEQDLQAAQAQAIETGLLAQRAYIELQRSVGGAAIAASIPRAQLAPSADTSPAPSKGS